MSCGEVPSLRENNLGGLRPTRRSSHARSATRGPVPGPPEGAFDLEKVLLAAVHEIGCRSIRTRWRRTTRRRRLLVISSMRTDPNH